MSDSVQVVEPSKGLSTLINRQTNEFLVKGGD